MISKACRFFEAIRQLGQELGKRKRAVFVHVTLLPYIKAAGEMKTKPTQHSVKEMRSIGIQPDILLCRCEIPIRPDEKRKIGLFCNVPESAVIEGMDAPSLYDVPLAYHKQGLDREVLRCFKLEGRTGAGSDALADHFPQTIAEPDGEVTIGVVGKYVGLLDAYKSLIEALHHGGIANGVKVKLKWLDSEQFEKDDPVRTARRRARRARAGRVRGTRRRRQDRRSAKFAREQKVPFFGICYGMQMAVIEAARNMAGIAGCDARPSSVRLR